MGQLDRTHSLAAPAQPGALRIRLGRVLQPRRFVDPTAQPLDHATAPAAQRDASHGARLLQAWQRLAPKPGGTWLFSRFVGRMAPYTGSMGARIVALQPGRAEVQLRDRRRVRNHLRSIHAIALANLGELASGLAMTTALSPGVRGIPVHLGVDYRKKARGTLTAIGTGTPAGGMDATNAVAVAEIRDEAHDIVAVVTVRWQLQRT